MNPGLKAAPLHQERPSGRYNACTGKVQELPRVQGLGLKVEGLRALGAPELCCEALGLSRSDRQLDAGDGSADPGAGSKPGTDCAGSKSAGAAKPNRVRAVQSQKTGIMETKQEERSLESRQQHTRVVLAPCTTVRGLSPGRQDSRAAVVGSRV